MNSNSISTILAVFAAMLIFTATGVNYYLTKEFHHYKEGYTNFVVAAQHIIGEGDITAESLQAALKRAGEVLQEDMELRREAGRLEHENMLLKSRLGIPPTTTIHSMVRLNEDRYEW